jgi:hypothetical protein
MPSQTITGQEMDLNLNFTLFCQKKTTKQGAEKAQLHSRGPEGPDRSSLQADGTLFSASNKKQTILLEKAFVDERRNHCLTRRRSSISTVRIRMAYARKLPTKAAAYVFSFVSFSRSLFSQIIHGNLAAKIEEKTTKNLATRATTAHGCLDNYR